MHGVALTERSKKLFPLLRRFDGFYLVGGTALALQIGHRLSVDFDLFRQEDLPPRLLEKVKRVFAGAAVAVTYRVPGQLTLLVNGVKMTFFWYNYPVVEPMIEYEGVQMLTVREIAATKAFSIGKRLAYKDYVDWYFMLSEQHVTLPEVIALAEKKYGNDFNDRQFIGQLVSFSEVTTQKIDFLSEPVDRDVVEAFLTRQAKELL